MSFLSKSDAGAASDRVRPTPPPARGHLTNLLLVVLTGIAGSLAATTVIHHAARTRTHPP